jgi:hypothetical protein
MSSIEIATIDQHIGMFGGCLSHDRLDHYNETNGMHSIVGI